MRAIIIEEDRFVEIREKIELEVMKLKDSPSFHNIGVDQTTWNAAINEVHRCFNYQFVVWAQSHGAKCVR